MITPFPLSTTDLIRDNLSKQKPPKLQKFRKSPLTFLFAVALMFTGQSHAFQSPTNSESLKKSMTAFAMGENDRVTLDGVMDENFWGRAEPAVNFVQKEPSEGGEPSERTEVYVVFNKDNLYIGAKLYDSEPHRILGYQKQRDAGLGTDDRFMWILDTFLDGRTGYFFEINPAGLMGDGLLGSGGGFGVNKSWDGIWEARVSRNGEGWTAEIEIPFRTLNFDPNNDTWGINFQRTVRRKNEEILWTGHLRTQRFTRPVHAGRLTGIKNVTQGKGIEIKPYAISTWNKPNEGVTPTATGDAGFDLSYNLTPSLRSALTVNTDFAEAENDRRRVNLTRFPLFFPERREFFLEGSSVFSFAPRNGVTPFFSRRIGLSGGRPIPVLFGGRLGGQVGKYEVGFLQIRTDEDGAVPQEDFTVGRVKRTIFEQSTIGAIYTRRATDTDTAGVDIEDRHTFGFDLDLFTSKLFGDKNFQFEAFVVWHTNPDSIGKSFSDVSTRGIRFNYPNDLWRGNLSYREFGDDFNPALGFTRRNGFKRVQPTVTFAPRPESINAIRQMEVEWEFEYLTSLENQMLTRRHKFKLPQISFETQDRITFELEHRTEFLADGFEIRDGILIPEGRYDTVFWILNGRTAGRRKLSGNFRMTGGEFWTGDRNQYNFGLTVRPNPGFSFSANFEKNDVELPEGSFETNLFRISGGWQKSAWSSLSGNIQYDDVSKILGLFTRYRWIINPGNDLFFVYTHNWRNAENARFRDFDFTTITNGGTTKINYTHRF